MAKDGQGQREGYSEVMDELGTAGQVLGFNDLLSAVEKQSAGLRFVHNGHTYRVSYSSGRVYVSSWRRERRQDAYALITQTTLITEAWEAYNQWNVVPMHLGLSERREFASLKAALEYSAEAIEKDEPAHPKYGVNANR